jgi:drug/metabolite transporter (DMT)-like permease
MKRAHGIHILEINLAMLFISTSGALGRYVDLPVPVTIGFRALLAFVVLWAFCKYKQIPLLVRAADGPRIGVAGLLMATHWITYFYALQWSNVAIGMLTLFTYPIFTALLEPLVLKTRFKPIHLLLCAMVLVGIYWLSPTFDLSSEYTKAVFMGLFSALAYAFRNLLLKGKVADYHGSMLMVYQTGITAFLLLPFMALADFGQVAEQWKGLLALALVTTAIGHTLFLMTFRFFSMTTVSILSSVQPIYGILIGALFLSEIPDAKTILGGIFILGSVVIESVRSKAQG